MKNGGFTIPKMFKLDSPVCGSCHFDRASNEEFSVKFWMSVLILFSARIEIRSERIQFPQNCLIWVNPIVCVKSPIIPCRCHNFQNLASIKSWSPLFFFKYPLELKKNQLELKKKFSYKLTEIIFQCSLKCFLSSKSWTEKKFQWALKKKFS